MKKLLKTTKKKTKKQNIIVMLARNKLNNIESKRSEALINSELVTKDLWQLLMKEKKY